MSEEPPGDASRFSTKATIGRSWQAGLPPQIMRRRTSRLAPAACGALHRPHEIAAGWADRTVLSPARVPRSATTETAGMRERRDAVDEGVGAVPACLT